MPGFWVGDFFFAYYGCMIVLGIGVASGWGLLQVKKNQLEAMDMVLLAAYGGLFGLLGAKGLYLWVFHHLIDWSRILDFSYISGWINGGFVFFGGILGGCLGLTIASKLHRIDVFTYLALCMPCIPLVHGFGRVGCFLAGCCYGIPYDGIFSIMYQHSYYAPNGVSLFPVQLLEAAFNFALAVGLMLFIRRRQADRRVIALYVGSYALGRFGIEFLRGDEIERGGWYGLSTSQWICMGLILIVAIVYRVKTCKESRKVLP